MALVAPEGDLRLELIHVGAARDASAAVAMAWASFTSGKVRTPGLVTSEPARDGWDERSDISYETSPNEKHVIEATALRAGAEWTVVILDGSTSTADKRRAAIDTLLQSIRPSAYKRDGLAGRGAHPMDAGRIAQLQAFVAESMKKLGIPGASFALTTREKTIYAAGLGVRELGHPGAVDANTEFLIASNTKGLATLLLAKLVDEGKLRWDEPVTEAYPPFRLGSAATTQKVLIRHLVCACTGLPRKDTQVILNSNSDAAAADTFAQLAATEPTTGFGDVFQYSNQMAAAAGYIGGHLVHPEMELDQAFERSMQEKIFTPLGMASTTFDFSWAMKMDWARPHADSIGGYPASIVKTGLKLDYAFTRYAGAGGAWSTASDLARYVRFELNEGRLDDGRQYISATNLLQRRKSNVSFGEDRMYGMGLATDTSYGVPVIHHGGSLGGYKSDILFIPSADIGAVILTNADNGSALLRPFMRRLLELVYDGQSEAEDDVSSAAARIMADNAKERQHITAVPDRPVVASLAPTYTSPDLGRLTVTKKDDGVVFHFPTVSAAMGSRKNDDGTFSFVFLELPSLFNFIVSKDGALPALIVRDDQHEYRYVDTAGK